MKPTASIDSALHRSIRILAMEKGRAVRDIVDEALRQWVETQEELEDLATIRETKDEPTIPWEQVKAEIRAAAAADTAA